MAVLYDPLACQYVYFFCVRYGSTVAKQLPILFLRMIKRFFVIIFDVYLKTRITPTVVNILMNYNHSGGPRNFWSDNAEHAMAVLYDCVAANTFTPSAYDTAVQRPISC